MVHLLVRFEGAEEKFAFSQEVISLGRVSSNTIQVKDVKASRNHCEIRRTDTGWKLVDLESSNGTSINGQKVNTHLLQPGDVIAIGQFEVVFEPAEVAVAPAPKPSEPIEKTVVEAGAVAAPVAPVHHLHHKGSAAEAPAMAASEAESRRLVAMGTKAAIAAAVLIAGLMGFNSVRSDWARRDAQEAAYTAAVKAADSGDLSDAIARIESFLKSGPEASLAKRATAKRDELAGLLAKNEAARKADKERAQKEMAALQLASGASLRFDGAQAQVEAYLANGDFEAAVDEAKQFLADCPEGELHDRMTSVLKNVLGKASDAWDVLEAQANELVKAERYAEATYLLGDAQNRFNGTRYAYEVAMKVRGIQRLSGVTAAYASGAPEMSAAAQETMLAVTDLLKARQYEAALKAFDKMVNAMPEKDRAAFGARRDDIGRETGIFRKLLASINSGEMKEYGIELGGNVTGHLSQASDVSVTIEFKDVSGKGGTTGRKWAQVPGPEMLAYFRHLKMDALEMLGLAAFCYDNRMPNDGADVVNEIIHGQATMQADAYALIARVRAMGVPSDGFVYFERGWYTKTEYLYAKLDYKAKKGADLAGKIDDKLAEQGHAIWSEMSADGSLEADFKEKVKGYFLASLHAKRQGIMKGLENSQNIAAFRALQELKKELNLKRAAALEIIYDKTIYPDENHGVKGQPKVDDAVKLVRDMWDKNLATARLDDGVRVLVEAGVKTNAWLKELGEAGDNAAIEEYELLLGQVNESLTLKTICLTQEELSIRAYNRKVYEFNKKNTETQMVGVELECAKVTNEYREMMGRRCLEIQPQLGKCAKKHSQEMVDLSYFAHESPTIGMKTPTDRAAKEGYTGPVGENICTGYGDARAAFTGWYNSSGHHRNMLSDLWNHIGLGNVGGSMWTENLGRGISQLGGASSANTASGAGGSSSDSSRSKNTVRLGVGGPKKRDAAPADQGAKGSKADDKGAKNESPYKQPDGKCTGTTPYDGSGGAASKPPADDKDKPVDKGDGK